MKGIKFEQFKRKDGLDEARVVRTGEEEAPLRRAVGENVDKIFSDEKEKTEFLEHEVAEKRQKKLGREEEWRTLKAEMEAGLRGIWTTMRGSPDMADAISTLIWAQPRFRGRDITLDVRQDHKGFRVVIPSKSLGDMNFDFGFVDLDETIG